MHSIRVLEGYAFSKPMCASFSVLKTTGDRLLHLRFPLIPLINFSGYEMSPECSEARMKAAYFSLVSGLARWRKYANAAVCRRAGVIYIVLAGQGWRWSPERQEHLDLL